MDVWSKSSAWSRHIWNAKGIRGIWAIHCRVFYCNILQTGIKDRGQSRNYLYLVLEANPGQCCMKPDNLGSLCKVLILCIHVMVQYASEIRSDTSKNSIQEIISHRSPPPVGCLSYSLSLSLCILHCLIYTHRHIYLYVYIYSCVNVRTSCQRTLVSGCDLSHVPCDLQSVDLSSRPQPLYVSAIRLDWAPHFFKLQ